MSCQDWELASWIATTIGVVFAILGLFAVFAQLRSQMRQSQLALLSQLYAQMDTHEARKAREYIYKAPRDQLRLSVLHTPNFDAERKFVEDTLATLNRLAYPIEQRQVPANDAFNLYGGVLLDVAYRLWPYVEDQRAMRSEQGIRKRHSYRRHLEAVIRTWIPKYAKEAGLKKPELTPSTYEMLNSLFSEDNSAHLSAGEKESAGKLQRLFGWIRRV